MTTPKKPPRRYVTVSVSPDTHKALLALLHPRETLDELVLRIIKGYYAWAQSR